MNGCPSRDDGAAGRGWSADRSDGVENPLRRSITRHFPDTVRPVIAYSGSLSKALQAIGAQEATLVIDTPATLDGDTTTPATLGLVFRKGGRIKFGDHNVRINGPVEAGPYMIFEGSGQVTIADNAVTHLYVEWWGGSAVRGGERPRRRFDQLLVRPAGRNNV